MNSASFFALADAVALLLAISVCRDARRTRRGRLPVAMYGGALAIMVCLLDTRPPLLASLGWPLLGVLLHQCWLHAAKKRKRAGT